MRKVTKVRLGIMAAVAVVGAAGAIAAGCSSDDSTPGVTPPTPEGGTTDSPVGPTADAPPGNDVVVPPTDGGADQAVPNPAQLVLTHAAPGIGPFRLCFATVTNDAGTVVPLTAAPDTPNPVLPGNIPGVVNGTIGAFPAPADLSTLVIRPYAILNIAAIANDSNPDGSVSGLNSADGGPEETCPTLIGKNGSGGRLVQNVDYVQLPDVPAGALLDETTYLLALVGCLPGNDAGAGQCGASYNDATGNLHFGVAKLDTTTAAPDGGIAVQFANLSSALEGTAFPGPAGPLHGPASAGVLPGLLVPPAPDSGSTTPAWVALGAAPVPYAASAVIPTTAAAVPLDPAAVSTATGGQLPLFGVLTLPGSDPDGGGGPVPYPYPGHVLTDEAGAPVGFAPGDLIALPFSAIQQLSRWDLSTASGSTPANFAAGQTYTFALMGDPAAEQLVGADGGQNPNYTGKGLHIVAFPNKFAPKQ